jgi:ATP adenylyltransferase
MAYVGGNSDPVSGCVFCEALQSDDDAGSLIVHRGLHAFAMLNLYPYNTGHLMILPNDHAHDLGTLPPNARSEMAELTSSFCTGLKKIMGCDGLNTGMNLGSAAGAGIADHLHQHIVPRWTGDANFMPIVGGTKVLPELIPATYGKIRAEVERERSGSESIAVVLFAPDRRGVFVEPDGLPSVPLTADAPVWKSVRATLAPMANTCELLGWGGPSSTREPSEGPPALALSFSPDPGMTVPLRYVDVEHAHTFLDARDLDLVRVAARRFGIDISGA